MIYLVEIEVSVILEHVHVYQEIIDREGGRFRYRERGESVCVFFEETVWLEKYNISSREKNDPNNRNSRYNKGR